MHAYRTEGGEPFFTSILQDVWGQMVVVRMLLTASFSHIYFLKQVLIFGSAMHGF